jgi:hypothetical protein
MTQRPISPLCGDSCGLAAKKTPRVLEDVSRFLVGRMEMPPSALLPSDRRARVKYRVDISLRFLI